MDYCFSKYSGCGNDFIFIDNRSAQFDPSNSALVKAMCHRYSGIGADGLILVEKAPGLADFAMRIFNSDSSEASMCGNALRCLFLFINNKLQGRKQSYKILTKNFCHTLTSSAEGVAATLSVGAEPLWGKQLRLPPPYETLDVDFLDTGVPHAVFFFEEIKCIDLERLGPLVRHHSAFSPQGANVNIAKNLGANTVAIRTFERGVEGETLACGSGAVATALAAHKRGLSASPVTILLASGETLKISFSLDTNGHYSDIIMSGPAEHQFDGTYSSKTMLFNKINESILQNT